ncbi:MULTISPECIES: hypothetical protein [unclassified Streptomyces]|uniref:hypothetical protein n=1 Tax=unclassified Streptomyces TaxID=2593676 RepID=UPI002E0FB4AB|nr:hypothetical protein OG452_02795 [Streptomyces sp. NBC_01197]WSS52901.1 hypothetical protein OG708_32270 [Streptomyces sp. NBC_01180]
MTRKSSGPDDMDAAGKSVPPYAGRRKSADTEGKQQSTRGGAKTGGATGPVTDEDMKAAEPSRTRGGATGSPADEKPADERSADRSRRASGPQSDDPGTGPSHHRGTPRAEDQP